MIWLLDVMMPGDGRLSGRAAGAREALWDADPDADGQSRRLRTASRG